MSKLTERQWVVSTHDTHDDNGEIVVRDKDGCIVANCSVDSHDYYDRKDMESHANLIAWAPELLEALKELARQEDWEQEDVPADSPVGRAWTAIAGAEGRVEA